MIPVILRYDGRWHDLPGQPKQWTIMSHFYDKQGRDRIYSSFFIDSLRKLGIVKEAA